MKKIITISCLCVLLCALILPVYAVKDQIAISTTPATGDYIAFETYIFEGSTYMETVAWDEDAVYTATITWEDAEAGAAEETQKKGKDPFHTLTQGKDQAVKPPVPTEAAGVNTTGSGNSVSTPVYAVASSSSSDFTNYLPAIILVGVGAAIVILAVVLIIRQNRKSK